jgi:hypothetical protein
VFQEGNGTFELGVEIYEGVGSFSCFVIYEVGDGSKIKFWHDLWCRDQSLKARFSNLFNIARCEEAWVANYKQFFNENLQCNISFTKSAHDWEVDFVTSSFDLLYSIRLREGSEDKKY